MNKSQKSFSSIIYWYGTLTLLCCATVLFAYASFFVMLRPSQLFWASLFSIAVFAIGQFIVFPILNKFKTGKISTMLKYYEEGSLTSKEDKIELYLLLMNFPKYKAAETFIYAIAATFTLCLVYRFFPKIALDTHTALISYTACIFGSYSSSLIAYAYSEKITNPYAERLFNEGIEVEILSNKNILGIKKNYFGSSILTRSIRFLFIPIVFSNMLSFLILKQGYEFTNGFVLGPRDQILRIIIANFFQIGFTGSILYIFFRYMKRSTTQLREVSTELLTTGNPNISLNTSCSDQIQYNVYLLGKVLGHYKEIMDKFSDIGKNVLHATEDLSIISDKISYSSTEQSADVKEILSTMEDSNALSKNVATRISEVSDGTDTTKNEVSEAFNLLKQNITQLSKINESNQEVIDGIKNLSLQIENIDDIVTIIRDIADQTKIIAFNAELEAVSSGKQGRNFHIVATEIRRLANNTMDSIEQIKQYVDSIKDASRDLIASSEQGTEFIHEESEYTKDLESQFNLIMQSSMDTNEKATEISAIIEQQTASFNQIVITLRQISSGIESFAVSTKNIINTVSEMKNIAFKLSNMRDQL